MKRKRRAKSTGKENFWRELALKYRHNSIYRQPRYTIKKKEEWREKKRKTGKLIFQQSACIIADRKFRVTIRSPDRETMASWEVNTLLYLRSHRGRARCRERERERKRVREISRKKRSFFCRVLGETSRRYISYANTVASFSRGRFWKAQRDPRYKVIADSGIHETRIPSNWLFSMRALSLGVRVEHEVKKVCWKRQNAGRVQVKMRYFNYEKLFVISTGIGCRWDETFETIVYFIFVWINIVFIFSSLFKWL